MDGVFDRLKEVADRLAIMELSARYNRAVLAWDPDGFADCFTSDGRFVRAREVTEVRGHAALSDVMRTGTQSGVPPSYHLTTDFIIEIDGNRATQTCQVLLYGHDAGGKQVGRNVVRGVGHYEDWLIRTPDGWKFTERVAFITPPDKWPVPIGSGVDALVEGAKHSLEA
jgi:hypothetical protein